MANCKESRELFLDTNIKGTFYLLDACKETGHVKQFIQAGSDARAGIYYYPQPIPIDENHRHSGYPGYYPLSKVLEEVNAFWAAVDASDFPARAAAIVDEIEDKRPVERYLGEARRLLGVLNGALEGKDWIMGEYSIADIAIAHALSCFDAQRIKPDIVIHARRLTRTFAGHADEFR